MSSSATASGPTSLPTSFTPAVLRQTITSIINRVDYNPNFLRPLQAVLAKDITSAYGDDSRTLQRIMSDIDILTPYVNPAPPKDATNRDIVINGSYSCRLPSQQRSTVVKVKDIMYDTKRVATISPTAADPDTAPTTVYPAALCSPVQALAPRTSQRGGQATPPPFPTAAYKSPSRSLIAVLEELNAIRGRSGIPAYDAVIKANQDRLAQQKALIDNVEKRVADLVAAEKGRLGTGLTAIQNMITRYTEERARAEVPAKQFEEEIKKYTDLLTAAQTRMQELVKKAEDVTAGAGVAYRGGRRRRGSRKSSRRSSRGRKGTRRSA
jgi:hypothetical protein